MATFVYYDRHPREAIALDPKEREIISSSPVPIHVFWINHHIIKQPENWPSNRVHLASTGKTSTALFVTYQSDQTPMTTLGLTGDLWLTRQDVFVKDNNGTWNSWNKGSIYECPYDSLRVLDWSTLGHFRYLNHETFKKERRNWRPTEGPPLSAIPASARQGARAVHEAINKPYRDLTKADCIVLCNAAFDHERGKSEGTEGCVTSAQPVHSPIPFDKYKVPLDNREHIGFVKFANGMEVFLPSMPPDPEVTGDHSDVVMIKWLANGQDATASDPANPTPMVSLLQSPRPGAPSSEWIKHRDEVRDILSRGRAVAILRGVVDGPGYTWDEESLVLLTDRRKDATPLEWQSALNTEEFERRNEAVKNVWGTIEAFLKAASNPKDSVNCLDMADYGGEIPWIIRALSSSLQAMKRTSDVNFAKSDIEPSQHRTAMPSPQPPTAPGLLDRAQGQDAYSASGTDEAQVIDTATRKRTTRNAKRVLEQDTSAPPPKKSKTAASVNSLGKASGKKRKGAEKTATDHQQPEDDGEPSIPHEQERTVEELLSMCLEDLNGSAGFNQLEADAIRSMAWLLLASSGAFTYPHYDSGGYATYVKGETGLKVWSYLVPKDAPSTLAAAMKGFNDIVTHANQCYEIKEHAQLFNIILPAGTLLIQPPGLVHQVYTLENSIFSGGHFFLFEAMHLTEVVRACAAHNSQSATNASHPACIRIFCRMAIAIAFGPEHSVLRKPFVSLARCILWAHLYAPGDEPQVDAKKIASQSDEATAELVAAQAIVQAILKHNNLTLDDIRPRDLTQLEWLSTLGEGEDWEDWRDPGTVRLGVPDMRSLFTSFQGL